MGIPDPQQDPVAAAATPASPDFHQMQIKVRGYHLDLYGHVNNARYLEFLEEARWCLIEERHELQALLASGLAFIVVNINIDYRSSATTGDTLDVTTSLLRVGNRSMALRQVLTQARTGEVVARADSTFVLVDQKSGRAVPLAGEAGRLIDALGLGPAEVAEQS